jgi:hypothetical protein
MQGWLGSVYERVMKNWNELGKKWKLNSQDPSIEDQYREVSSLASQFEQLQRMPGWEKLLKFLVNEVNGELLEAANKKYDREGRLMHCDMWHAKREFLDAAIAYMDSTIAERDRLVKEGIYGHDAATNAGN